MDEQDRVLILNVKNEIVLAVLAAGALSAIAATDDGALTGNQRQETVRDALELARDLAARLGA